MQFITNRRRDRVLVRFDAGDPIALLDKVRGLDGRPSVGQLISIPLGTHSSKHDLRVELRAVGRIRPAKASKTPPHGPVRQSVPSSGTRAHPRTRKSL